MKYCSYCGASILEGAAFCMECGETIPVGDVPQEKKRTAPQTRKERRSKPRPPKAEESPRPQSSYEDGYDGYYDDVPVLDEGAFGEKLDKELVRRILLVGMGALAVVILAVVLMRLL